MGQGRARGRFLGLGVGSGGDQGKGGVLVGSGVRTWEKGTETSGNR